MWLKYLVFIVFLGSTVKELYTYFFNQEEELEKNPGPLNICKILKLKSRKNLKEKKVSSAIGFDFSQRTWMECLRVFTRHTILGCVFCLVQKIEDKVVEKFQLFTMQLYCCSRDLLTWKESML